jgi:hypothetical protein
MQAAVIKILLLQDNLGYVNCPSIVGFTIDLHVFLEDFNMMEFKNISLIRIQ